MAPVEFKDQLKKVFRFCDPMGAFMQNYFAAIIVLCIYD